MSRGIYTINYGLSYYLSMAFLWHLVCLITGFAIQLNYRVFRELIGLETRRNRASLRLSSSLAWRSVDWYLHGPDYSKSLAVARNNGIAGTLGTPPKERRTVSCAT